MQDTSTKWIMGHKIRPYYTSGDYDLIMGETPPHVPGPPPHLHQSFNEVFLVVEGEMEFMLNGEIKVISAGESVDIPPHALHTFGNKSDQPCKWVNIHSPKGFRAFFETYGIEDSEPQAARNSVSPDILQRVMEKAADFDMHIKI